PRLTYSALSSFFRTKRFFYCFLMKERLEMLDLAFIRSNPDKIKEACRLKNNTLDVDYLLKVDQQVLDLQHQVEQTRAEQNQLSKRIQGAGKDKELREQLIAQGKKLSEMLKG